MQTIYTKSELKEKVQSLLNEKKTIGLVPTMGALHEGHMSLVQSARDENDIVICSIFVNPTQFNNKEDLEKYPRTLVNDQAYLKENDCDIVFAPQAEDIYDHNHQDIQIDFYGLDKVMEGPNRPGHFEGVVNIVHLLFSLCKPTRAYFGEKDFQQLSIIRALQKQKHPKLDIIGCEIIREKSGLAMSSRNARLSGVGIERASEIFYCLQQAKGLIEKHTPSEVKEWVEAFFDSKTYFKLEYFSIANAHDLSEAKSWKDSNHIRAFVVVHLEDVRLIDNIAFKED